jgi:hypothetical protein
MFKSAVLRRLTVCALLISVLTVGVPVLADGGNPSDETTETALGSGGVLDEILEWLLGLADGSAESEGHEGEGGANADPSG